MLLFKNISGKKRYKDMFCIISKGCLVQRFCYTFLLYVFVIHKREKIIGPNHKMDKKNIQTFESFLAYFLDRIYNLDIPSVQKNMQYNFYSLFQV